MPCKMGWIFGSRHLVAGLIAAVLATASPLAAAPPSAKQSLKLAPIQKGVTYDHPTPADMEKCTVQAVRRGEQTGWIVRNPDGQILRVFTDSNDDNVVDQWSYFRSGLEIYRDIDSNFNGKADQCRWFHTGGSRWGIDRNEDGKVDAWYQISAEEVVAEMIEALKTKDAARFSRLLLSPKELKSLGVGPARTKEIMAKIEAAAAQFPDLARGQKTVLPRSTFVDFGGTQPGVVPAGTQGAKKDLLVYENVAALVETDGKHEQIHVGTIVRVGRVWRLIDVPKIELDDKVVAHRGYFFQASLAERPKPTTSVAGAPNEKTQKMMAELESLDRASLAATPKQQSSINRKKVQLLEQMAGDATDPAQRSGWVRQMADTVSASVQAGTFPDGLKRLQNLETNLKKRPADRNLVAYVKFRRLSAIYGVALQDPKADFAKIQAAWLGNLKAFVKNHPKSSDAAEALLQLAIAEEFSGQNNEATRWYKQVIRQFPKSPPAQKAAGAVHRLGSVGKSISLEGTSLAGKSVDLGQFRGKIVLIQYWATWCEPCIADMARLKELHAKYGGRGFAVVGVNLDNSRKQAVGFLKKSPLPWPQIHESGGLESRPANEMGILTLPTMILVDAKGRVANRNIHVSELDVELKKLLR